MFHLLLCGAAGWLLSSCGNFGGSFNRPLDGNYDPLDSPGARMDGEGTSGSRFTPGTWVEVTDYTAAFYRELPAGNRQPARSLPQGTSLKVVGSRGTYVKVETESGAIGYVPSVMVGSRNSPDGLPSLPDASMGSAPQIEPVDGSLPAMGNEGFVAPEPEVPPIEVERVGEPAGSPVEPAGETPPAEPPESPTIPREEPPEESPQPESKPFEPALPPDPVAPSGESS